MFSLITGFEILLFDLNVFVVLIFFKLSEIFFKLKSRSFIFLFNKITSLD